MQINLIAFIVKIFVVFLVSCTGPSVSNKVVDYKNDPNPPLEFCLGKTAELSTFLMGIKEFGTISSDMPKGYRACLENQNLRAQTLEAIKKYDETLEIEYKKNKLKLNEEKKTLKKNKIKDQKLVNDLKNS